eukprot:EC825113.1.p1 GENE.EC825113.1~~EC825113.1.p1  ORF type:complete len:152 (+),score=52.30 EC825113.1:15-470(+)
MENNNIFPQQPSQSEVNKNPFEDDDIKYIDSNSTTNTNTNTNTTPQNNILYPETEENKFNQPEKEKNQEYPLENNLLQPTTTNTNSNNNNVLYPSDNLQEQPQNQQNQQQNQQNQQQNQQNMEKVITKISFQKPSESMMELAKKTLLLIFS